MPTVRAASGMADTDGRLGIGTDHLDFERLLRIAGKPHDEFSGGTVLGHMHLNVGDLDRSQAFYESDRAWS